MSNVKEELIKKFKDLLEDKDKGENDIQRFLEENTELIPTPFLLGHQVHFSAIISKFKISENYITDFAFLTKCSDEWNLVLIEIEDAKKSIFRKSNSKFHSEFNNAYDQISEWKSVIEKDKKSVIERIDKLKIPLERNPINIKYVLVIGRNSEKNTQANIDLFATKNTYDTKVMTYDSIMSMYMADSGNRNRIILTPCKKGFKIKYVPDEIHTSIFAHIKPEYLLLEKEVKKKLIDQGYKIDRWMQNYPLTFNDKYDALTFKETSDKLLAAMVTSRDIERKFD